MADPREGTKSILAEPRLEALPHEVGCVVTVRQGEGPLVEVELREGLAIVGTGEDCNIRLNDPTVSGRHLSIEILRDGILVTDLGSKNGTHYLNGRIQKAMLPRGAALRLGNSRMILASRCPPPQTGYSASTHYGALLGASPAMRRMYATLEKLEPIDYTTLILGETGVGKELVAREIHTHSRRASKPFEVCDCTALAPTLIESELFGHARGAFTGAQGPYAGVFERARGGTLFLDEIGELPLELQPKLLRVMETKQIRRVGSGETVSVDVRVVAATNRDLANEAREKRFRQDLFYRLNMVTVHVSPLRERREDIAGLVTAFVAEMGVESMVLSEGTLELFTTGYDWPGNVRELRNAVAHISALGTLPQELETESTQPTRPSTRPIPSEPFQEAKRQIVNAFERDYLRSRLEAADHNITHAAQASGMERMQFKRLLRKHGLLPTTEEP